MQCWAPWLGLSTSLVWAVCLASCQWESYREAEETAWIAGHSGIGDTGRATLFMSSLFLHKADDSVYVCMCRGGGKGVGICFLSPQAGTVYYMNFLRLL